MRGVAQRISAWLARAVRSAGLVLFALLLPTHAAAEDLILSVDATTQVVDLSAHLEVLEDAERRLSIDEVQRADAARLFHGRSGNVRSLGFTESAWWVRFTLRNVSTQPLRLVVRQNYPLIDYLDLWTVDTDGTPLHVATGDLLPFESRPIRHNEFLLPLTLAPGAEQPVYLRFVTAGSLNIGLWLYSPDALVADVGKEQLAWGAFYGSILLLALGTMLLFLLVRDPAFGYYFVYLITYGCYMAAYNGLSFQYLWPSSPQLASLSQLVLLPLSLIFLLQFSRIILGLGEVSRRLDRVARVLQWLSFFCIPLAPLVSYRTAILPIATLTLLIIAFLLVAALHAVIGGRLAAKFYLAGLSIFLLGVLIYMLKTFGLLPHNALTQHGYQVGSIFEFLLIAAALGARVGEIKRTSITDRLTGLFNRRHFDERFAVEFEVARTRGRDLALLVVDIDLFKRLNDTYGHAEGDRALRKVAAILMQQLRLPDVGYRYGGEEFVVMMPGAGSESALAVAEQLRERIAAETAADFALTVSIGVATMEGRAPVSAEDLFRQADAALYAAKSAGRNRVVDHPAALDPASA